MRGDPPRHIRDIAHLYLSRMRRPGGGRRVVVAGISADVIPAFHVANLALAAAARGLTTRIEERSGLPVNAGCFLGLDPSCWVPRRGGRGKSVAAFARVTFALVPEPGTAAEWGPGAEGWDGLEIVHAPPWDAGLEHARAIDLALARAGPTVVLYLAERDEEPCPWRGTRERPDMDGRVAYVTRAGRAGGVEGCVGIFTRWTRALTDPLPLVLRDADSRLARQYGDAVSTLLADAAPMGPPVTRVAAARSHVLTAVKPR
jgi:hypothetical protein